MRRVAGIVCTLLAGFLLIGPARGQTDAARALRVTEILPEAGSAGVQTDTAITVIFNRPVVPLVVAEDLPDLPQPLAFEPEIDGQGEWLNTSVYIFHPDGHLRPGTVYTATVNQGLQSVDGATLTEPYVWRFATAQVQVLRVNPPDNASGILLEPELNVYLNQLVDHLAVESQFFLRALKRPASQIPGTFEWSDDGTTFTFRPSIRLAFDTAYQVGIESRADGLRLTGQTQWTFLTVPLPKITGTSPRDGQNDVRYGDFSIFFASPMDESSFEGKITVDPIPERRTDYHYGTSYHVSFPLKASTSYTVTIAPGLKDIYGNTLAEGLTVRFSTPPITPNVALNVPGRIGFYNAYNDETGLFVNHINVGRIETRLYAVPLSNFLDVLLGTNNYAYYYPTSYVPPDETLLYRRTIPVYNQLNSYVPNFLSLGEDGPLPQGVYFLRVTAPDEPPESRQERTHLVMVMSANVTVKASLDTIWVWATDVNTGEPVANAPVTLYAANHRIIGTGVTDEQGMLAIQTPPSDDLVTNPRIAVLYSATHVGIGATFWADGIDPGLFGQQAAFRRDPYRIYVYTDRPVYRPNQTVYFRAVVREKDDMTYTRPEAAFVSVGVFNSKGDLVFNQDVPLTPFGTVSGEFPLSEDAPLGPYRVHVGLPQGASGTAYFSVAKYRLPEFQVEAIPEAAQVVQGEAARALIDAQYYFGGAVKDAAVDYTVIAQPTYFHYDGKGYYSFYDYDDEDYIDPTPHEIADGAGRTDDRGQFLIDLAADLGDKPFTQTYRIEATVRDASGYAVTGRTQVMVHPGRVYVGAQPERYVNTAGRESRIDVIAVDWDSQPIADQRINVAVVERRWNNVQEMDSLGRTAWVWEAEDIPVTRGQVTTDSDGRSVYTFTPPKAGVYRISLSTRDEDGNVIRSAVTTWVTGKEYVWWRQRNDNRIDLIPDRDGYHVGDTAEIMVASPFQGTAHALVTVERAGIIRSELVTMDSNSYVYRLPIEPDFAPNVFVSVMLVKGVDEHNLTAAFRMGLIQLRVDTEQKEITVEISADRERAAPGETVQYTVRTSDYLGHPVQAEVGVALTDLASLALADSNSPTLLDFFYNLQGLGVRTATPLTINTDELSRNALDMIKGGGGGMGVIEVREDFLDTPYWNPALVTDDSGQATFRVTLPDNLTTWRLDARAVTSGDDGVMRVGQGTFDLISTRPLLIRPVTPRFFVVDDRVTLAAVVNNNTEEALSVGVWLQASGLTVEGKLKQTVTVPAGGQQHVEWAAQVNAAEQVELVFYADGGAYTDASRPPLGQGENHLLPVYRYEAPETVGTAGVLRAAESRTEAIALPRDFEVSGGELTVHLEPSLAVTTLAGLRYLEGYPHECIEQTVSRFLPNIITYRALAQLGLDDPKLKAGLNHAVWGARQRLYALQKADGGWGWFAADESNPLTTAYALIGLVEAQKQGFAIEPAVIARAQAFLQTTFVAPDLNTPNWRLNRQAFVLYALARSGAPDIARTANLFEVRERLNLDAKAFLAMTYALIDPHDPRATTLVSDLVNAAAMSAIGAHWEEGYRDYWNWSTDARSTAIVLDALVSLRPESELIPNAVRWLVTQRTAQVWATTQETAWAVMALTDWMALSGELQADYTYAISMNGDVLTQGAATPKNISAAVDLTVPVRDLLRDEANQLVIERDTGTGVLYYTAHLEAILPVPEIEALDRGIIIQRTYSRPGDEERTPVSEARVGEVVQVRLTVIAPNDLYYVVIEDPIPAGAEAVNPNLNTEQQIGVRPSVNRTDPLSRGWGWWWFSSIQFHDEKAVLYSSYLPAGTYEYVYSLRAAIPGVYNVSPTTGQQFYFPEVYGRGDGNRFTVLPPEG